uniref:Efflux pump membrane transporter n=1 Tax=Ganoderma boninense TaxID=34458 RepID=A0A5K1K2X1_9APHY|nr:Efflux pump membrane transporter [Ganoderma boninense]
MFTYVPSGRSPRTTPIIHAVYHHPLLVTLSQSFHLSLYDIGVDSVTHTQTLSSFTSYPPSSLVLSTPSATTYKLILAYAIPVYPAHWTVGATELIISSTEADRMMVTNTRTTRAIDIPPGWIDEGKMRAVREQWDRKVARVADTQTDGKWVVLAPGQNLPLFDADAPSAAPHSSSSTSPSASSSPTSSPAPPGTYVSSSMHSASGLQLYRLHLPASPSSSSLPRLTFVRTLHGQIGPVSTLALSDGRCVSLGVNGSIWVWDLEAGTGTEVSAGACEAESWEGVRLRLASGTRGAVVFDDRRIVSACGAGVEVRRFDI